ncbi:YbbR family protein [Candidatus Sulfopaludibacter sp. SbA3]|nr:YbbR family protein [Candidatus Sulfopaludibacter sp. SbA3]
MRRAGKWVWNLVSKNLGWKLLSVAMAVVLWALVASEPELSTFATVQLAYRNLPDDLEIASEPVPSIVLELRGSSAVLRGMTDGGVHPAVVLEMSSVLPGERTFTIGDGNVKLSRGVRLVRTIPSQVRFVFERRLMRQIPVMVRFNGEGSHGYDIASQRVDPPQLTVPASHVARITGALTDPVDVSNVVGSSEFRSNAYVSDPYVRFQSSPQVTVTVTMRKQ